MRTSRLLFSALVIAGFVACGGDTPTTDDGPVTIDVGDTATDVFAPDVADDVPAADAAPDVPDDVPVDTAEDVAIDPAEDGGEDTPPEDTGPVACAQPGQSVRGVPRAGRRGRLVVRRYRDLRRRRRVHAGRRVLRGDLHGHAALVRRRQRVHGRQLRSGDGRVHERAGRGRLQRRRSLHARRHVRRGCVPTRRRSPRLRRRQRVHGRLV